VQGGHPTFKETLTRWLVTSVDSVASIVTVTAGKSYVFA